MSIVWMYMYCKYYYSCINRLPMTALGQHRDLDSCTDIKWNWRGQMLGRGTNASVMQPTWTPKNELLYLGDQSNWWNLYHMTASGNDLNLSLHEEELGGPQSTLGQSAYNIDPCGTGHILTDFVYHLGYRRPETPPQGQGSTLGTKWRCYFLETSHWSFDLQVWAARYGWLLLLGTAVSGDRLGWLAMALHSW